tara:strand:- start:304 stop:441 length:138 start_codon:yes stop_codon:yes gene_type:complete
MSFPSSPAPVSEEVTGKREAMKAGGYKYPYRKYLFRRFSEYSGKI